MQVSNLDTLSSYLIYVLKGLFIAMINLAIIHKNITVKQLIFFCCMPFFISLLLLIKLDINNISLFIPFFTNLFLLEDLNILKTVKFNIKYNSFNLYILKHKFFNLNTLNPKFFNLDTLGGTPELPNVNLSTPAGQTGIPRGNNNPPLGPGGINILNPESNNTQPIANYQANPLAVLPIYERDIRPLRDVYEMGQRTGNPYANPDAINQAKDNFSHQLSIQEEFKDKELLIVLRGLRPKIRQLITNFEDPNHTITISDCAEAKYILSQGPYAAGARDGTRGFYNANPVLRTRNSISSAIDGRMYLRRAVSTDLRSIQRDID